MIGALSSKSDVFVSFLLTVSLQSDIFVLSSDKYVTLEETVMKKRTKLTICLGVICALLAAISSCYTIAFNNSRFIVPMDLSEYVFRVQDLPMIISGVLLVLYIVYLVMLLLKSITTNRRRELTSQSTRTINPKLGFLGLFGFAGFLGFWTYSIDKTIFPFVFFLFFGFFGFYYEGKMSNTFIDERYKENKMKAQSVASKTSMSIIFLAILILGQERLISNLEYTLIALVIVVALSIALEIFLSEYLLYHYDSEEQFDESEE